VDYNENVTNACWGPPASVLKCRMSIWVPIRRKNARPSFASE
jgi:hypothetical protein